MKKNTGSFDLLVTLDGVYRSRNRQSSEVLLSVGLPFVARQSLPCYEAMLLAESPKIDAYTRTTSLVLLTVLSANCKPSEQDGSCGGINLRLPTGGAA